jgi:hypothetical protein
VAVFTPTGLSVTSNVTGGNILSSGIVSATGNVYGNQIITSGGGGGISASGNIQAGNLLTTGFASATGNATAGNILTGGLISATGNATAGNILTAGLISATSTITSTANISGGNILTVGLISSTGNVTGGNILTGNTISAGGNVLGVNFIGNLSNGASRIHMNNSGNVEIDVGGFGTTVMRVSPALVSVTGNVTANYFLGNGALLTGISGGGGSNISNGTSNITVLGANANISVGISGVGNVAVFTPTGLSVTSNVTGGNVLTSGVVSATGNIFGNNFIAGSGTGGNLTGANVISANIFSASGNVYAGNVTATGNVQGNYILGNGALLTGVTTSSNTIFSGNSNVAIGSANANVTVSVSTIGNVAVFTPTGLNVTGNVTGGNLLTSGILSATGNVFGNNFIAGTGTGGNLTGANVISANTFNAVIVSATGNITGNYFIGNGSLLTGISGGGGGGSNISNGNSNVTISTANANVTVSVSTIGNVAVFTPTGLNVTGNASATGNVYANTFISSGTGGGISAPGNIIGGNILTGGFVSATGNITGNYFIGNGSLLTGIAGSGGSGNISNGLSNVNIASANANVIVSVSGTGNVAVFTPTIINITGNISASGNIVAGGVRSTSSSSAPTNPTTGDFWFNTSTNVQYRFTFDGTNYYWVDDFGATVTTQPLFTGPVLFNDVSTQTNGQRGVFALKDNQANVAGISNSKQLQVVLNGAVQTPFVKTWVWPFWCVDVSFKGFKVTTLGYTATANSVVFYRPPAKGTQVSITQVNTATDSQLLRYPFSATTIAISD